MDRVAKRRRYLPAVVLAVVALVPSGCGAEKGAVFGTVTYKGKAVSSGQISFMPRTGIPVTAEIQPDGTYRVIDVPVGTALVTVIRLPDNYVEPAKAKKPTNPPVRPPAGDPAKDQGKADAPATTLPVKYADTSTTDLKCEVQSGETKYDVPLQDSPTAK